MAGPYWSIPFPLWDRHVGQSAHEEASRLASALRRSDHRWPVLILLLLAYSTTWSVAWIDYFYCLHVFRY